MKNTKIGIRTEVRDRLAKFVTKKGQTWNDIVTKLMDSADRSVDFWNDEQ